MKKNFRPRPEYSVSDIQGREGEGHDLLTEQSYHEKLPGHSVTVRVTDGESYVNHE